MATRARQIDAGPTRRGARAAAAGTSRDGGQGHLSKREKALQQLRDSRDGMATRANGKNTRNEAARPEEEDDHYAPDSQPEDEEPDEREAEEDADEDEPEAAHNKGRPMEQEEVEDAGDEPDAPRASSSLKVPPAGQARKQSQAKGSSRSTQSKSAQRDKDEDEGEGEGEGGGGDEGEAEGEAEAEDEAEDEAEGEDGAEDEAQSEESFEAASKRKKQKAAKKGKDTQRSGGTKSTSRSSSGNQKDVRVQGGQYRTLGQRTFWTDEETNCLKDTLDELCTIEDMDNLYSTVLALHGPNGRRSNALERRNPEQLKDKAINICKKALREGEAIPYWKQLLCSTIWNDEDYPGLAFESWEDHHAYRLEKRPHKDAAYYAEMRTRDVGRNVSEGMSGRRKSSRSQINEMLGVEKSSEAPSASRKKAPSASREKAASRQWKAPAKATQSKSKTKEKAPRKRKRDEVDEDEEDEADAGEDEDQDDEATEPVLPKRQQPRARPSGGAPEAAEGGRTTRSSGRRNRSR